MAEYLAPGVYVEERPGQRAIEGVSTSTAGFVGMTERGPVEGPPILITSFGEFQRQFGGYMPIRAVDGDAHGCLPVAVRQFFDNGGKRAFVARAYRRRGAAAEDDLRRIALQTGVTARLRANAPKGATTLYLSTLRGLSPDGFALYREPGTRVDVQIAGIDPAGGKVTLAEPLTEELRADTAHVQLTAELGQGAQLYAREPGVWGEQVRVQVRAAGGAPTRVQSVAPGASAGQHQVRVASAASFYVGAAVELLAAPEGGQPSFAYGTVAAIAGNVLTVVSAAPIPAEASAASLVEAEILISWRAEVERFRGALWYMDPTQTPPFGMTPAQRDEFNAMRSLWPRLSQRSRLVRLRGENGRLDVGTPYDPGAPLAAHPATETGHPAALQPRQEQDPAAQVAPGTPDLLPDFPEYVGDPGAAPGRRSGLAALEDEETISIVAIPGITRASIQAAIITHAERMKYRMAVLDGPSDADIARIREHRGNHDSSYAALYHPWIQVAHPATGELLLTPPSGAVSGVYARSDVERGVHKAPANEVVSGAIDVAARVLHGEQEVLNPEGINVIRDFRADNRGIRIWGARTISSDPAWKYVNVRRLFLYIERSIDRGTQWVVFEPNNQELWGRVRRTVETFLEAEWRKGALFGARPEEAFWVKCDRSTMSLDDIENGRLVCEIGIAPTKPAEFVIFRIGQLTADARAS